MAMMTTLSNYSGIPEDELVALVKENLTPVVMKVFDIVENNMGIDWDTVNANTAHPLVQQSSTSDI